MKYAILTAKGETSREIYLKENRFAIESEIKKAKDILLKMGYKSIGIEYLTKQEFSRRKEDIPPLPRKKIKGKSKSEQ